ncbi:MAG: hypothetical protein HQ581_24765 [Planctomycetes bacterium]|nr:hypothetical protein [Planctomycetota bacterium]
MNRPHLMLVLAGVLVLAGIASGEPVPEKYEMPFVATTAEEALRWQTRPRARLLELVEA